SVSQNLRRGFGAKRAQHTGVWSMVFNVLPPDKIACQALRRDAGGAPQQSVRPDSDTKTLSRAPDPSPPQLCYAMKDRRGVLTCLALPLRGQRFQPFRNIRFASRQAA